MHKLVNGWERGLVGALCISIALVGVGRLEFSGSHASVSAWSVSRTTFFFWLIWKFLLLHQRGWTQLGFHRLKSLGSLGIFFVAVTISLLPDFHQAGDYRYFFFGCVHAVMLVDVFFEAPQRRWLPYLLGVLPIVLVLRGFLQNPAIFSFSLAERFTYPLDHPNTAGYLLAMSSPLCLAVALVNDGWRRGLGLAGCAAQLLALFLSFSRGAWLGWLASTACLAFMLKKAALFAAFTLALIPCALVFPEIQNRLISITRPEEDLAMQQRWQRLTSSLRLGLDHPVLGVGYGRGRLKETLPAYLEGTILEGEPVLHTHNVYVELFAETGAIGLATFLWFIGRTLGRLWGTALARAGPERILGFGLTASWIAAMITGLGDIPFYHHGTRIYFFTLFALAQMYCSGHWCETVSRTPSAEDRENFNRDSQSGGNLLS